MPGNYILVDGKPVLEPDVMKWSTWYEQSEQERIVEVTDIGEVRVSTVFLSAIPPPRTEPPLLYETVDSNWEVVRGGGSLDERQVALGGLAFIASRAACGDTEKYNNRGIDADKCLKSLHRIFLLFPIKLPINWVRLRPRPVSMMIL